MSTPRSGSYPIALGSTHTGLAKAPASSHFLTYTFSKSLQSNRPIAFLSEFQSFTLVMWRGLWSRGQIGLPSVPSVCTTEG